MFNSIGLPYLLEAEAHNVATNELPSNEWIQMCARCGVKKLSMHETESDNSIWNKLIFSRIPVGTTCICTKCALHFLRFEDAINDCKDLITCSNYIQMAITCRKQYLKTAEKSKQQASLDRCLSMRLKEF